MAMAVPCPCPSCDPPERILQINYIQINYIQELKRRSCRGAKHLPLSAAVIRRRLKQIPTHTS